MSEVIDARSSVTGPQGRFAVSPAALIGIAIHHSVSGDYLTPRASQAEEVAHIQAVDRYHVEQDFGGIGYHMAAFASGRLYLLGDLGGARAHVAGRNHELLGVVAIGTFTERQPEQRQLEALRQAIHLMRQHAGNQLPVKGHGGWALPGEGTICPGLIRDIDWDAAPAHGDPNFERHDMVRFNGIVAFLDGKSLPNGVKDGVLQAPSEFHLPPGASRVRLEIALQKGSFAVGDGAYAGRVDDRFGCRLGIIDADLGKDGILRYDCAPGTVIDRVGCLGYWI